MKFFPSLVWLLTVSVISCEQRRGDVSGEKSDSLTKGSYAWDRKFLNEHVAGMIELANADGQARILVSPVHQGRVMTSTARGDSGLSFGWLNYAMLSTGKKSEQFNPVGGEERFWMGPEGGQYSIYFKRGDSFLFKHWKVPSFIDTDTFAITAHDQGSVSFAKDVSVSNYSGTGFSFRINRNVALLQKAELEHLINRTIPEGISFTAYRTINSIINSGTNPWNKNTGMLSVWLLGMFSPSPATVVMIPFKPGGRNHISTDYFGMIPSERLVVRDSFLFFLCDGKFRSKIGISPLFAKPAAAAVDFDRLIFTLVIPEINASAPYVNSKWELQERPYEGDAVNSYNDGPLSDGSVMGPFFEIESSSPALNLKPLDSASYKQITCHFQGSYSSLRELVIQLTGIDPDHAKPMLK